MCNLSRGIVDELNRKHAVGMHEVGATDALIAKALKLSLEEVQAILEACQEAPEEA
jgi:hypothetical protein